MATTQSIHMGPEWMRPQPASQTTINPPGKNPSSQPPPLGIAPNALRHVEGLKTSVTAATVTNVERGGLGTASTAQAASANGTSASGTTPALPYSSLLNSGPSHQTHNTPEILDGGNQDPFRYSRDQLVSLWRNGTTSHGGLGWSLGIEVERYEGIVLDFEGIPACSRELTEAEQKVYSQGSLNSRRPSISHTLSEHRRDDHVRRGIALNGDGEPTGLGILGRRGTADGLSLATTGKGFGSFVTNGPLSPMKDRFARRDPNQTGTTYRPRQPSFGTTGLTGDRDAASPSTRGPSAFNFGGGSSFSVLSAGDGWGGRRKTGALADVGRTASQRDKIQEIDEFAQRDNPQSNQQPDGTIGLVTAEPGEVKDDKAENASLDNWEDDSEIADVGAGVALSADEKGNGSGGSPSSALSPPGLDINSTNGVNGHASKQATPPPPDPATVKWNYYDDNKNVQGPFTPDQLKLWYSSGWLRPNLIMLRTEYDKGTFQLFEWQAMAATRGIKAEEMFYIWHAPIASAADLLPLPVVPHKEESKPASIPSAPVSSVAQSEIGSPARSVFASITSPGAQRSSNISLLSGSRGKPRTNEVDSNTVFTPLSPARMQARPGTVDSSSAGSPASVNASTTDSALGGGGIGNGGVFVRGPGTIGSAVSSGQSPFSNYHPTAGRFSTGDPMHAFGSGGLVFGNGFGGFEDPLAQRLPSGPYTRTYDHSAVASPHQAWSQSIGAGTPASYGRAAATFGGRRSESPIPGVGALGGDVYDVTGSNRGVNAVGLGIGQQPAQPTQRYVSPLPPPHEQQPRRSQSMFGPYPGNKAQVIGGPVQPTQPPAPLPIPPVVKNDEEVMNRPKGPLDQELIPTILPNSPVNPIPEGSLIQKPKSQPQPQTQIRPPALEVPAPAPAPALAAAPEAPPPASAVVDDSSQPFTQAKNKKHHHPLSQLAQVAAPAPVQPAPAKVEHASNAPLATMTVPLAALITHAVSSPSATSAPKTAWATPSTKDDATKSLTLKEIQEAEERRAKGEAARQKAVATSALPTNTIPSSKSDEVEHLTWGLPTSKAGSRPNATPTPTSVIGGGKEVSSSGPVWATGSKGGISVGPTSAKKTMKEIQDEEERKRRREKDINVTTAAKKVTESNKPSGPSLPTIAGSAWSTVGAGGKVTSAPARPTGLAALPPKPTAAAAAANRPSTISTPLFSTAAGVGMPARKVTPSSASKPTAAPAKPVEETQEPPVSAETMRWMKDSLQRGVKPGSSVDVIIGMVLSIQEEEFIADIIYQSSEAMDGRRWAAELLSRRKADAASTSSVSRVNGRAGSTSGSMAEVLKAQPKQPAQDFGYKVVKKKGKSGRA